MGASTHFYSGITHNAADAKGNAVSAPHIPRTAVSEPSARASWLRRQASASHQIFSRLSCQSSFGWLENTG